MKHFPSQLQIFWFYLNMVGDQTKPILALNLQTISAPKQSSNSNHIQELFMANNQNPSHSITHDINRWVRSFDFTTKTNFTTFKLEGIKSLKNVKINWEFLCAAKKFQDTKDHVFRFNTAELCPIIKEFSTIIGYEFGKKSIAVSCDPKHREILFDALGLSVSITSSMIEVYMVNLHAVVTRLLH